MAQSRFASLLSTLVALAHLLAAPSARAEGLRIDEDRIVFGYEGTFQTQLLADHPSQLEHWTPRKQKLLDAWLGGFAEYHMPGAEISEDFTDKGFKPGVRFSLPKWDDTARLTMEQGCIEWNMSPLPYYRLAERWAPVYESAEAAGLTPNIYQAGTGGGGGHIHVGGVERKDNPFIQSPTLLRNLLVLFHERPALLHGFAEAYDFGPTSMSMRTFHSPKRQRAFEKAIRSFDKWYAAKPRRDGYQAALRLIELMRAGGLIGHDYFINIDNFETQLYKGGNDKFTVEFRNIRPLPSGKHVQAVAKLLLKLIERYSDDAELVPFEWIDRERYRTFSGPSAIESDWESLKRELGLRSAPLDELVHQLTRNPHLAQSREGGVTVREAYSDIERKGSFSELLQPRREGAPDEIVFRGRTHPAQRLRRGGKPYLGAVILHRP